MRYLRFAALLGICLFFASFANAQRVFVGVGPGYYYGPAYYERAYVGTPPVCAYGYYGYYPYACAPYGYYGPDYCAAPVFPYPCVDPGYVVPYRGVSIGTRGGWGHYGHDHFEHGGHFGGSHFGGEYLGGHGPR